MTNSIAEISEQMMQRARRIIHRLGIEEAWRAVGAEPHLVGSVSMGLLMKHRDIDYHIYSSPLHIEDSFAAVARIAAHCGVEHLSYLNLLHTEEACIEWHLAFRDECGEMWQIDMIHIVRGSRYDGYFERQAACIAAALTPESREVILRLKYETPPDSKIAGIEYYRAVIEGGVCDYEAFEEWRRQHPVTGIVEWMP